MNQSCYKCSGIGWVSKFNNSEESPREVQPNQTSLFWIKYQEEILNEIDRGITSTDYWLISNKGSWVDVISGEHKGKSFSITRHITRERVENYLSKQNIQCDENSLNLFMGLTNNSTAPEVISLLKSIVIRNQKKMKLHLLQPEPKYIESYLVSAHIMYEQSDIHSLMARLLNKGCVEVIPMIEKHTIKSRGKQILMMPPLAKQRSIELPHLKEVNIVDEQIDVGKKVIETPKPISFWKRCVQFIFGR